MIGDETQLLVAAIEAIFDGHDAGECEFDEVAWRRLTDAGFSLVSVPNEVGGSGGSLRQAGAILRAVSRLGLAVPLAESSWLAGWALGLADVPIPTGPMTATLIDESAGQLTRTADGWRLDATLHRVPWAADVELIVGVIAHERPARIVLLDPGCVDLRAGHNLAGEPRVAVRCSDLALAESAVATTDFVTSQAFRARAAVSRVVGLSGAAEKALRLAVTQAQQREQFGRPLARFQAVQQLLARMAAETTALVVAGQAATAMVEDGPDAAVAAAAAKVVASEFAGSIAAAAHQVLGAMGFTMEHHLQRSTRRLWAWRDEYGNERVHASNLAESALKGDPWTAIISGARS